MPETGRQRGSVFGPDGGERGRGAPMRRVIGWGEDPLQWAIPLGRWLGLRVGLHIIVVPWAIIELLAAIYTRTEPARFQHRAAAVGAFIGLSLIRELSRAFWASRLGRQPDHLIVWPLGGLGRIGGPTYQSAVLAEAGGLLFGVVAWAALAAAMLATGTSANLLLINPFDPGTPAHTIGVPWKLALWWAYYANGVITCINLLPMRPFDGGRIVHAALRAWREPTDASTLVARLSAMTAISLFLAAAAMTQTRLLAVAALGALATWLEFRREVFVHELPRGYASPPMPQGADDLETHGGQDEHGEHEEAEGTDETRDDDRTDVVRHPASVGTSAGTPTEKTPSKSLVPEDDIDLILAKISREGISSLSEREKESLRRATEAKRKAGGVPRPLL